MTFSKRIEELVERVATYLEQYAKDVRALHRNPNRLECANTARELLAECPDLALIEKGEVMDKPIKCDHIFERLRLDLRRCIECGLEQVRYIDPVEPLRWVDIKEANNE